ncbi:hypothetical protein PSHT_02570 [Puccinia striiformis]|uniref:Uncharacterized protein n=1 Tax=Puccinia striiformis TaxID=27350 RepID=A0A2S4WHL5_9BASI|nr:hypothetical protein PSHT_02570 [Puccinia striiformis]
MLPTAIFQTMNVAVLLSSQGTTSPAADSICLGSTFLRTGTPDCNIYSNLLLRDGPTQSLPDFLGGRVFGASSSEWSKEIIGLSRQMESTASWKALSNRKYCQVENALDSSKRGSA